MKKKLLLIARILHAAFLVFLLVLSLFSCKDDDNDGVDILPEKEIIGNAEENKTATFPSDSPYGLPYVTFVEMNQTLYGLGQLLTAGTPQKIEVWSTKNGADWAVETTTIGTNKRRGYAAVTFNGKLWVIGGKEGSERKNDVWSSENGKEWKREIESPAFAPRDDHHAVVLRDSLYIIGGNVSDGTGVKAAEDIWRSRDGVNWQQVTNKFTSKYLKIVVLDNVLYAFKTSGKLGSIYKSVDGKAWKEFTTFDLSNGLRNERMIVSNGYLWIAGSSSYDFLVWRIDSEGKAISLAEKFTTVSDLFKTDPDFGFLDDGFYGITIFQDKFLLMMKFNGHKIFSADLKE